MPDIDKLMRLAELFGVTTDYLLRDDIEEPPAASIMPAATTGLPVDRTADDLHHISMDDATAYLDAVGRSSKRFGLGVALCVSSPVVLIALALAAEGAHAVSENAAVAIGLGVLLVMVAAAVVTFVLESAKLKRYEFLESEAIALDYGVEAAVRRKQEAAAPVHSLQIAVGVGLCIVGAIPVTVASAMGVGMVAGWTVCLLLVLVAVATFLFVSGSMTWEALQKLLQEEEFTLENKRAGKKLQWLPPAFWGITLTVYLAWSFITMRWDFTWIVWPIAGVLFAGVYGTALAVVRSRQG